MENKGISDFPLIFYQMRKNQDKFHINEVEVFIMLVDLSKRFYSDTPE